MAALLSLKFDQNLNTFCLYNDPLLITYIIQFGLVKCLDPGILTSWLSAMNAGN